MEAGLENASDELLRDLSMRFDSRDAHAERVKRLDDITLSMQTHTWAASHRRGSPHGSN